MKLKVLDWDSDFFQKKIGELHVGENAKLDIISNDFDVIYAKSEQDFDVKIKGYEPTFAETKVLFSKKISTVATANDFVSTLPSDTTDITSIYELAFESGKYSRFNLDTRFTETEFKKLYQKWVDNSFLGKFADEVLVYKSDGKTVGFVTYKSNGTLATIGLIATAAEQQGKGVGTQLIKEVERRLKEKKVSELQIPTQLQNMPACKFYAKLGYEIIEKTIIKHYWKI